MYCMSCVLAAVHIVLHVRHWLKLVILHLIKHENHSTKKNDH